MTELRARQVHLDFHTSEHIHGVGESFDGAQFQAALQAGHVNSITVFAKCHHSWSYYPTKVGAVHPHLRRDLLGDQIQACHEIGVRAPIYYTVGWSANDAESHPEWLQRGQDGTPFAGGFDLSASADTPKGPGGWKNMCVGGPHRDLILAQTEEICQLYPVDGFFYDICFVNQQPCWCGYCTEGMKRAGLDPSVYAEALQYAHETWRALMRDSAVIIHRYHPEATIYYNGMAHQNLASLHGSETHFELEDLPTTWGGYDKLPPRARHFARTGKQYLGMTGKFHTWWGEFGGFKHPGAMRFECAMMLAYGARCSIGDQLHPSGLMDPETYRLIGHAFSYVESIEQWSFDAKPIANLGVYLSGRAEADEGLAQMLLEEHLDFVTVEDGDDVSALTAIVLPDCVPMTRDRAAFLRAFVARGGGLVLTGESGLEPGGGFAAELGLGLDYLGASPFTDDYVLVNGPLSTPDMARSPLLCYESAKRVRLTADADAAGASTSPSEVLAWVKDPYFNRTYGHYCSHQNTPYSIDATVFPAAVRRGNVVYLAHSLFTMYHRHGAFYHRQYFAKALELVYGGPRLKVALPSCGRATLNLQAPGATGGTRKGRYVAHLLYAPPLQRGRTLVIEDTPALPDVKVEACIAEPIARVYLAPQGVELPFVQAGGSVTVTVPEVTCHQIVVLDLA